MRLKAGLLVVCALALSCGHDGDGGAPAARLAGRWFMPDSDKQCVYGFSFRADGYIESDELCTLTDGSAGMTVARGKFEATETSFTWSIEESSCAFSSTWPETLQYTLEGDELTLTAPQGILVLKKVARDTSGPGGEIAFGCFDEDGGFETRSIQPI